MIADTPGLMDEIRSRFAHVETCPFEGRRIFFENAGGALHLKSVVETSAFHAAIPDNPGRANAAGTRLQQIVETGKADMRLFFNARSGRVFVGESGTELLFRLVRAAALGTEAGGAMIGSTLEHPATASARARWAGITGRAVIKVPHDDATGTVGVEAYRAHLTPDIRVATILHTSPVTGMAADVAAIAAAIREVAPAALIVVDGIQHASHGAVDVAGLGVDGYAISPYKMFARHGYGVAWASDRLGACGKDNLAGGPADNWELGTRDAGAYATFSDVVSYLDWLGGQVCDSPDRRARLEAAGRAIAAQDARLARAVIGGTGTLPGLGAMAGITLIGGDRIDGREGVVSFRAVGRDSPALVEHLRKNGIRVHTRKADHYSGNVLVPLGMADCVRLSFSHYNTEAEVARFLSVMQGLTS
ncbi:aminotransferase class V-fold PLP-dependent enzyme [Rhodovulum tesquicola]|uniref:aminotransferase class V-fold PLP-dependent enzyme n=1 Tax=Rhodovulum tesquicola TaxID=540254 RepID=UPI002096D0DA|nr:aminotransferase class V-fold PLP-dependent enzyme [Rhodovulum tesquicola]MCO8146215.1 aminotransferase class V-fold PLP-dependent enzyme [Rhodovulum tesquicola]